MNWRIDFTIEFSRGAKVLKKRYRSFMDDLEDFKDSILQNPFQGVELVPGIRKVRLSITSKGKSGGARVITLTYCISEEEGESPLSHHLRQVRCRHCGCQDGTANREGAWLQPPGAARTRCSETAEDGRPSTVVIPDA